MSKIKWFLYGILAFVVPMTLRLMGHIFHGFGWWGAEFAASIFLAPIWVPFVKLGSFELINVSAVAIGNGFLYLTLDKAIKFKSEFTNKLIIFGLVFPAISASLYLLF